MNNEARLDAHETLGKDQVAADADQTAANSDQKISSVDQGASDSDQAGARIDQHASDRDQAIADRQHAAAVNLTAAERERVPVLQARTRDRIDRPAGEPAQARPDGARSRCGRRPTRTGPPRSATNEASRAT